MHKSFKFILVLVALLLMSNLVYAEKESYNSLRTALNSNSGTKYLKGEGKSELIGLTRDIFNIVRVIVVTVILLSIFKLYGEFTNAANNPSVKASIKTKTIWLSAGLVFTINFWNIYSFIAKLF